MHSRLLLNVVLAGLLSQVVGCGGSDLARSYSGTGYTINFPSTWEGVSGIAGADILMRDPNDSDGFSENVTVVIESTELTNAQYAAEQIQGLKAMMGATVVEDEACNVNGQEGHRIRYSFSYSGKDLDNVAYLFVNGEAAYVITLSCLKETHSQNIGRLTAIAKSFKFTTQ